MQNMIEINSSIHHSPDQLHQELLNIQHFLLEQCKKMDVNICGGGTHPFQKWLLSKIFPTKRYKQILRQYRYLSHSATVFGQHVHLGCLNGEDAIYLTHALARFVPQIIALSASSPFYLGIDTGFQSARLTVFTAFPTSGVIPYLESWQEFSDYFYKMRRAGILETMKDIYWDIRPKPEFGTVELRVLDTPLTIKKAILLAAYVQALGHYLLQQRPLLLNHDLYYLYNFNRFQSCRYGFEGDFIEPVTLEHTSIFQDILNTINLITPHANILNTSHLLAELYQDVINKINDTEILRTLYKEVKVFPSVVLKQCDMWENNNT